jgi:hypothetical protein
MMTDIKCGNDAHRRAKKTAKDTTATCHRRPRRRRSSLRTPEGPETLFADVRGRTVYHADLCEPTTDEWSDLR